MKIQLPRPNQVCGRDGTWVVEFLYTLATMPEAEIIDLPQQRKLSDNVRELYRDEEEELLRINDGNPRNKIRKRGGVMICPTQIGNLQQAHYTLQMLVDGKRVVINTREYSQFNEFGQHEFDLILDCQYDPAREWPSNVVPFVMFPRHMTEFHDNLDRYRKIVHSQQKKYKIGWAGCSWRGRNYMMEGLADQPHVFMRDNWESLPEGHVSHGARKRRRFAGPDYETYLRDAGSWEWGLVMYGRGSNRQGANNQREHEFAALGVPMILNYKPTYYVPFEAGKHYLYAKQPEEVLELAQTLTDADADEIQANAYEYWKKYMSREGICDLFRRICREHL